LILPVARGSLHAKRRPRLLLHRGRSLVNRRTHRELSLYRRDWRKLGLHLLMLFPMQHKVLVNGLLLFVAVLELAAFGRSDLAQRNRRMNQMVLAAILGHWHA